MALTDFLTNISSTQIKALTTTTINKLDGAQVAALNTKGDQLSAAQVGAIDDGAIASLDFSVLTSKSIAGLTAVQIDALATGATLVGETKLNADNIGYLSAAAVGSFDEDQLDELSTEVDGEVLLNSLNSKQVQALATAELSATTLGALSDQQVSQLSTSQMAALNGTQLGDIGEDLDMLTSAQLKALSNNVLKDLDTTDLALLSNDALKGLESQDFMSLSDEKLDALFLLDAASTATPEEKAARIANVNAEWVTAAYLDQTSENP
jgi:trimeric autotransporter adhesin